MTKEYHYPIAGFGERLTEMLEKKNMTGKELGNRINVDRKTVYAWKANAVMPGSLMLMRMCNVLRVSSDYLIFGKQMYMKEEL